MLPNLVPPIDREYTFRFFTGQTSVSGGEARAFQEWFPYFCEVGRACASEIEALVARDGFMATGEAKIVDNAIMGFTQSQRSRVQLGGEEVSDVGQHGELP